jgi:octaprenyl-diphosphate synthase
MKAQPSTETGATPLPSSRLASKQSGELMRGSVARVYALLGAELAAVETELGAATRMGPSPGAEAAAHLHDSGGKRIRPLTVLLAARCFGDLTGSVLDVAVAAELVHLSTLLHDDVIDDGHDRRGRPTSRRLWGNGVSVLAGDRLLVQALERTATAAPPSVLTELLATLRHLVNGEILQLEGRLRLDAREEGYFEIARDKTSSLFAWAARAGATCAGAPADAVDALGDFGTHAGLAFQLVDDVLDYTGDPRATGKVLLADLAEGKLTLPLIRALDENPELAPLIEAVRRGDPRAAPRVAEAVRASGACDGVRELARAETARALAALATLPPSSAREMLADVVRELSRRAS